MQFSTAFSPLEYAKIRRYDMGMTSNDRNRGAKDMTTTSDNLTLAKTLAATVGAAQA
jgi:hypothetical protein